ncbi:hypothetical protein CTA2_818, partial [Colletotrichum tanaceti]
MSTKGWSAAGLPVLEGNLSFCFCSSILNSVTALDRLPCLVIHSEAFSHMDQTSTPPLVGHLTMTETTASRPDSRAAAETTAGRHSSNLPVASAASPAAGSPEAAADNTVLEVDEGETMDHFSPRVVSNPRTSMSRPTAPRQLMNDCKQAPTSQDRPSHVPDTAQLCSANYTATLSSSVVDYPVEYGRRYHAFRPGSYIMPNDEVEAERLDMAHAMMVRAIGNRLFLAPIEKDNVHEILDIGTGTGIWAVEMGDIFENAQVTGIDLSAIQPS